MRLFASVIGGLIPLLSIVGANRIYTIQNRCPSTIKVFVGGQLRGTIEPRRSIARSFPDNFSGFLYTDANGGTVKGSKSTKAGFYGETDYYYILKDRKGFNVGINITPKATPSGAFCNPNRCDSATCTDAFGSTPTRFPGPENTAPAAPLFACPDSRIGYTVTFCPSGTFPIPRNAVSLRPNGNPEKCVNIQQGVFTDGAVVDVSDCKDTPSQKWVLKRGQTPIQLAGTPFCLDAGAKHQSPSDITLRTCAKGSPAQTWKYVHDHEISLVGTGLCLDLTNGTANIGQLQSYHCSAQATTQVWSSNSKFLA